VFEILTGRQTVREALRAGRRRIGRVLIAEGAEMRGTLAEIAALCRERGISLVSVPRRTLDELAAATPHQGVAAEVSPYPLASLEALWARATERGEPPLFLALDSVQDPQNVGSLLRTAEAVGVHGVIIPEHRAAPITPAVSRASAGAVEHLLVAAVTNLARALRELKAKGLWVVGVEHHPRAQDYRTADLSGPLALVVGSEGRGLGRLILETCDWLIAIPMQGQVNSLNVAVAGSLILYEAWRRRSAPST